MVLSGDIGGREEERERGEGCVFQERWGGRRRKDRREEIGMRFLC
jgi:hypothetical protein